MTAPRLRVMIAAISLVGLAHSGPSAQFVVLRQALAASEPFAATDSSAVSADGRFVAFVSRARMSPTDTRRIENIYVFDRIGGTVELETVAVDGAAADGMSRRPMLSADGRYLVFASDATNLLNASDTNVSSDVFLRDRTTGTTRRISVGPGGEEANGTSGAPAIGNGGQVIVFASTASNLAGRGKTHGGREIYLVCNRGEPTRVSVPTDSTDSFAPALSADGNVIAFVSSTFDRKDIFVRDLRANIATCISCDAIGNSTAQAYDPHLSGDGRLVVFTVARDRRSRTDIAVHDRRSSRTTLITREANASSTGARTSANGRFIAFQSLASNLSCSHRCRGAENDHNLLPDIYVFDRDKETFARVSSGIEEWWVPSVAPWLDAEGRTVIFSSRQPFDADDPTTDFDLFVRTLDPPAVVRR